MHSYFSSWSTFQWLGSLETLCLLLMFWTVDLRAIVWRSRRWWFRWRAWPHRGSFSCCQSMYGSFLCFLGRTCRAGLFRRSQVPGFWRNSWWSWPFPVGLSWTHWIIWALRPWHRFSYWNCKSLLIGSDRSSFTTFYWRNRWRALPLAFCW